MEEILIIKFKFLIIVYILITTFLVGCSESDSSSGDNRKSQSSSQNTTAQVTGWKPQEACEYFSDVSGLETRGYKNQFEDTFGCSSPYREVGVGDPLPNNIAFYVGGTSENATELKLVLNVHVTKNAKQAHQTLLVLGEVLTQKAVNARMPPEARSAVLSGKAGEWELEKTKIKLLRDNWTTEKGYELKYILTKES